MMEPCRGIIAVYKPIMQNSAQICSTIKYHLQNIYKQEIKVGHGGTLDPFASGVLIIGIGDDCKKLAKMIESDKIYIANGLFGIETDTLDVMGHPVEEKSYDHVSYDLIQKVLPQFIGEIKQIPPMFSAKRVNGQRLYNYAFQGKSIERKPNNVVVHSIQVENLEIPKITMRIHCGKGTYIRSLVADIARACDTRAYVVTLERVKQGIFDLNWCLHQEEFSTNLLKHIKDTNEKLRHCRNIFQT